MEPAIRATRTAAIKTVAVATRVTMFERRACAMAGWSASPSATSIADLLRARPEAPHPSLVGGERLIEVRFAEIRPERRGAVKLGIGRLPEQEVAQTHFAGGADDQVRVGQAAGIEMRRQPRLVELRQIGALAGELADSVDDLEPSAIVDGDVQDGSGTDASAFTGLAHLVLERRRQFMDPSGKPEFDAALCQLINLPTNGLGEQAHQGVDLVFGTRPVFCGKGIEGEHPDATLVGRLGDTTDGLDPCLVTHDARQQPLTGPAAVAIHDDRDVLGRGQLANWWFFAAKPP